MAVADSVSDENIETGPVPFDLEPSENKAARAKAISWKCATDLSASFAIALVTCGIVGLIVWACVSDLRNSTGAFIIMQSHEMLLVRQDNPGDLGPTWGLPTLTEYRRWMPSEMERISAQAIGNSSSPGSQLLNLKVPPYSIIYVVRAGSRQVDVDSNHDFSHQWKPVRSVMSNLKLDTPLWDLIRHEGKRQSVATAFQLTDLEALDLPFGSKVSKLGAGFLLRAEDDVLLLKWNNSDLGTILNMPGGSVDLNDEGLMATAERAALEQMGTVPDFQHKGKIDIRSGRQDEEMFRMFLVEMPSKLKDGFEPVLSAECQGWGWYPIDTLHKRPDLHPIVYRLMEDHSDEVQQIFDE